MAGSVGELVGDIAIVLALIALSSFLVAAEIALISLRESQIKQMAGTGKRGARVAALTASPNRFLAAIQVGITVFGFLSAAIGAERLGRYLIPFLEDLGLRTSAAELVSLIGLTLIIAYISLIIGELTPKRIAIVRAVPISLASAGVVEVIARLFRPIIWLLSKSTDLLVRAAGVDPKAAREQMSEEELIDLLSGHHAFTHAEKEIVEEVFEASDRQIHSIMVPRTEVDFLDSELTVGQAVKIIIETGHSRYPVVKGSFDDIIGFINVRDLLDPELYERQTRIGDLVRTIEFIPGTRELLPVLSKMRADGSHIAIVVDEYGGTDGIITLEDLVEQFVGDIRDEYDHHEIDEVREGNVGEFHIDGLTNLSEASNEINYQFPEGPYESIGGLVTHKLGRIAEVGDAIELEGCQLLVESVEGKRPAMLRVLLSQTPGNVSGESR
ncbi:MAG: HlyC/CorC family transporter [Actinobacteria bacterium]|nr:HlyC/CorC family transporter [Actinomycetota bacterium]